MNLHEKLKENIHGELCEVFLTDVVLRQWANKQAFVQRDVLYYSFEEMPFSIRTMRKDRIGRPIVNTRFIDVVFFVGSGKAAAYHGDYFTIGIEIKSNLMDLLSDNKMIHYVGKTDYCFLGVEDGLIEDALRKVENLNGFGVVSLTTGHIIRQAPRQFVDADVRQQFLLRAVFKLSPSPTKLFTITKELISESFQVISSSGEDDLKGSTKSHNILSLTNKYKRTMNFVGNRTPEVRATRLELKNGKFTLWKGPDQDPDQYDFAEGQLVGIEIRRRETRNGEMVYCDFHFRNGDERFDISTIASSCVTADIVSRLKNVQDPVHSVLRIDAWQNNRYTNVMMRENGRPVVHANLPRVQKIDKGFKVEMDSSARDAAVMEIIETLNAKLLSENTSN